MTPERYHQVNQLFHEALERTDEDRADFLKGACGDDESLRLAVERMLVAQEQAGSFLNAPAFESDSNPLIQEHSGSLIGRVISHYRILSKLGEGGMGEVLLAQDTRLERRVALKLLPAEFTSNRDRVRRFEQEARAASALNHPNIVTIHEIGQAKIESGDLHFIAQELIEGETLRGWIKQRDLSLLDTLDVAIQAASALQVAHTAGIAHRDIKPENMMLRPDGFIKILDFGLAKLLEPDRRRAGFDAEKPTMTSVNWTAPGMVLGTAAYMSPEQARGLEVDGRSDIWSLGVVLYETITGRSPFQGETMADVIVSILDREPPPLPQSLVEAQPELGRIVMKALAKSRDERYQTMEDFGGDLKRLKHRLEFAAELARLSPAAATPKPPVAQFRTEEQLARQTGRLVPDVAPRAPMSLPRILLMAAIALLAPMIVFFAWSSLRPESSNSTSAPAPERQITYWLTIQKMRGGTEYEKPFESTGQEIFETGWRFRINFVSPQSGHFYLLTEAPVSGGAIGHSLLFPTPSNNNGSARMTAGQPVQTGWYVFSGRKKSEKLWLIWSADAVSELEAVKGAFNPTDKGVIRSQGQLDAIRELLSKHSQVKPEIKTDKVNSRTEVKGRAESLVHLVELERR
ncbi:MAG TPA: serine/threonine-protein kinase [Blastocatellia bacterium]|nr:serine/threonine-protein kinase [Blastocatellia bacterium]